MWELLLIFFLAFFSSIRLFSLTVSSYFIVIFSSKKLFSEKYTKRSKLTIYLPSFWTIEKQNRVQSFSLMNMYVVQCTHTTHCIRIHIHIRIHPFAVQSIHQMKSRVVIRLISYKQQNIVDSVSDLRLGKVARKKKEFKKVSDNNNHFSCVHHVQHISFCSLFHLFKLLQWCSLFDGYIHNIHIYVERFLATAVVIWLQCEKNFNHFMVRKSI